MYESVMCANATSCLRLSRGHPNTLYNAIQYSTMQWKNDDLLDLDFIFQVAGIFLVDTHPTLNFLDPLPGFTTGRV